MRAVLTEERSSLVRLHKQLDFAQFALVTVTTDLPRLGSAHFPTQLGVSLPVLFDDDQDVSRSFMVRGRTTRIGIVQDGALIGRAGGPRARNRLKALAVIRQVMESGK